MHNRLPMIALAAVFVLLTGVGAGWPQYKGPQRNDVSQETGLLTEWPAGPKLVWTNREAGIGYSGLAVVGERLFTIGGRGETEFLIALDISAGQPREVWATQVGPLFQWTGNKWSAGPASTPTVDGELIFALGGMGDLICVEAASGKEVWRKNLPEELQSEVNPIGGGPKKLGWGYTWSPLVNGEQLLCLPGGPKGTIAALNKRTGEVLWRSTEVTDQAAYTSPVLCEIGGVRQCLALTNQRLYSISTTDGKLLWKYPRRYSTEVVNSPIVSGNLVYLTVGAGQGCDLVRVSKQGDAFAAENVYANKNMTNHHGNVLLFDDYVYGFSEGKGWMCQNLASGEIVWSERTKLRAGSVTCADGKLYCYSEDNGTCVLIDASPAGWKERGRFQIPEQTRLRKPSGRIWTPPVVAGGRLFLRDQELLFCFDVRAAGD
jgi:outer membrane protein assembly factor BamB